MSTISAFGSHIFQIEIDLGTIVSRSVLVITATSAPKGWSPKILTWVRRDVGSYVIRACSEASKFNV